MGKKIAVGVKATKHKRTRKARPEDHKIELLQMALAESIDEN